MAPCACASSSARMKSSCCDQGIDANLAHPSPRAKVASRPDDPGWFIEDFCNWQENESYRRFIFDSRLAAAAAALMRSQTARLYHDHMLTKEPGTRQRTPWHQDQPYYNIEGRQNCSFWIPVDPVSRGSTLELVAGSSPGPVVDAALLHGRAGQMVSRRNSEGSSGHRSAAPRSANCGMGDRARRCGVLPHADLACGVGR